MPHCTRLLCPSCLSNNINNILWNSAYCYSSFPISFPFLPTYSSFSHFFSLFFFLSLARSSPLFGFDCCYVRFCCCLCCFLAAQVPRSVSCPLCPLKMPAHPSQGTSSHHAYLEARLCMCHGGCLKTALASWPPAQQLVVLFIKGGQTAILVRWSADPLPSGLPKC
jgi:hypothetical protein